MYTSKTCIKCLHVFFVCLFVSLFECVFLVVGLFVCLFVCFFICFVAGTERAVRCAMCPWPHGHCH